MTISQETADSLSQPNPGTEYCHIDELGLSSAPSELYWVLVTPEMKRKLAAFDQLLAAAKRAHMTIFVDHYTPFPELGAILESAIQKAEGGK